MSLLVTGSIGIDSVQTPFGVSENCLGGSAIYFSIAASYFTPVRFIGVIGSDCPFDLAEIFAGRDVDLSGLEVRQLSKTFRWKGSYHNTMNEALTENVELNVLAETPPAVPEKFRDSDYIFLANTMPMLQLELLDQIDKPKFVAADTMNCWIQGHLPDLKKLLERINCLVINEDEARMLAMDDNLVTAADKIGQMGPEVVIIKKGHAGSMVSTSVGEKFVLPAYPASMVKDPTGAGDSFAGALMGYLAKSDKTDFETLRRAVAYGTIAASFTISDFSLNGIASISLDDISERLEYIRKITTF